MHGTVSNLPVRTVLYSRKPDLRCCRTPTELGCGSGKTMEQVGRLAGQGPAVLPGQPDLAWERPAYRESALGHHIIPTRSWDGLTHSIRPPPSNS